MARIEGIRIKNFRSLRDVTLGKLDNTPNAEPLTPMTAVIGKNGVGKSSLFDAFGFLSDCLKSGVEEACDLHGRGGFQRIISQGKKGPIGFEVGYKEEENSQPISYEMEVNVDNTGRPYVQYERLTQYRNGQPLSLLILLKGIGFVTKRGKWIDPQKLLENKELREIIASLKNQKEEDREIEYVELEDKRKLGIATLGSLKQHPRISAFRSFIEGWYLSYFSLNAARNLPPAGPQKHLNIHGDNLGNVVQFMEREHPKTFQSILDRIAARIPGIQKIDTAKTADGRLLLRFNDKGFQDPFYSQQISDGTLKVFAYLLLLEDPTPPPFLCIEEPENGLYHKLLETLAEEFRRATEKGGSQIFITTHQPYFVDALKPEEVWILEKGADGFATIKRASDDETVKNMVKEGLTLGGLWYSDYLDAR